MRSLDTTRWFVQVTTWLGVSSDTSHWSEGLRRAAADLTDLNETTERQFVALGEKLMSFSIATRQLTRTTEEISAIFSDKSGIRLDELLMRSAGEVKCKEECLQEDAEIFRQAQCAATDVSRALAGISDTVSICHVLGSLIRIETARLGNVNSEFGNLAGEVARLTEVIEANGKRILSSCRQLQAETGQRIMALDRLREQTCREIPAVLNEIAASLAAIKEQDAHAQEVSARQASDYSAVSTAFDDLIAAMQFHDITRQKIEHIRDALLRLETAQDESDAGMMLSLQDAQLRDAARIFNDSITRIEANLHGIARHVTAMAAESGDLLSAREQDRFVSRMEKRFARIEDLWRECGRVQSATEAALRVLDEGARHMRTSAAEVAEIQICLQRMAINAMIRASQIGNAGRALDLLAGRMQLLAGELDQTASEVAAGMKQLECVSGRLSHRTGADGGALVTQIRGAIRELSGLRNQGHERANEAAITASKLRNDIQAARAEFTAGALFREICARTHTLLLAAAEKCGAPPRQAAAPAASFDQIAGAYTMRSERDVHKAVASETSAADSADQESEPVTAESELGGNVELF